MSPGWLLMVVVTVPLLGSLFWVLGGRLFDSRLTLLEYLQFVVLLALVVAGGYQLYFWVQRNNRTREARCLQLPLDARIPFVPAWIWPYSLFYYLMIGVTAMSIRDLAEGVHLIFGGAMLLVIGCFFFYLLPTRVPGEYRDFPVVGLSTRYLAFVQSIDNDRNAFPSMHCALATYVGLAVADLPLIGAWLAGGYILFIVLSCLLVKQHVLADTLAGVLLGSVVYRLNEMLPLWMSA